MAVIPRFDRLRLTEEQIAFYRTNGFIQIDGVLASDELEELRAYMEEAMDAEVSDARTLHKNRQANDGGYSRVLNQVVNVWRDHGGLAKYSFHPRLADLALQLSGASGIRFFHDHALWKMPGDSKPTPWHQDFPYWPMTASGHAALSIWIALDDVDEHNGCMMFIPGSQGQTKLPAVPLNNPIDLFDYVEDPALKSEQPVICRMKAGSATFHCGLTFHYAHANVTDKPRRAFAIIYMPDGTIYSGKRHVITDPLALAAGAPIAGGLCPLLAKA